MTRNLLFSAAAFALAFSGSASAQGGSESPVAANWRSLYEQDIAYLSQAIPTHYIYAYHPRGTGWERIWQRSIAQARRDAGLVHDYPSYRAVLQRFITSFEDAHLSAYFNLSSRSARWPGFSVEYQGGRYVVTASRLKGVVAGEAVSGCDGKSLDQWVDDVATYVGGPKGIETTRATIGAMLFVDRGNPFYQLPVTCRIGNRDVALGWSPAPEGESPIAPEQMRTGTPPATLADMSADISAFGNNGAWVRMGTMIAYTAEQAEQFRRIIDAAPTLRDKNYVILDVRGNAGGIYNWFMAFLRGLYGPDYADYHARARLEIAPAVMVFSSTGADDLGLGGEYDAIKVPDDPPLTAATGAPSIENLPNGAKLLRTRAPIKTIAYPKKAPPNPVRARVYVLTDYGCASACLSFVDEMMRFPGVVQIGTQTHIDRRSGGWPEKFELPSGLAFVRMGRMVRDGRRRGENEPWRPSLYYRGDIVDTAAVKQWVLDDVVGGL